MVIYVPVDCESDSRQGKAKVFINFRGTNIWNSNMAHKTCQNVSWLLLQLKSQLEKDAILAGPK